jgi:hypothetical protein
VALDDPSLLLGLVLGLVLVLVPPHHPALLVGRHSKHNAAIMAAWLLIPCLVRQFWYNCGVYFIRCTWSKMAPGM